MGSPQLTRVHSALGTEPWGAGSFFKACVDRSKCLSLIGRNGLVDLLDHFAPFSMGLLNPIRAVGPTVARTDPSPRFPSAPRRRSRARPSSARGSRSPTRSLKSRPRRGRAPATSAPSAGPPGIASMLFFPLYRSSVMLLSMRGGNNDMNVHHQISGLLQLGTTSSSSTELPSSFFSTRPRSNEVGPRALPAGSCWSPTTIVRRISGVAPPEACASYRTAMIPVIVLPWTLQ